MSHFTRARRRSEGIYCSNDRILLGLVLSSLALSQEASCSIETYAPCLLTHLRKFEISYGKINQMNALAVAQSYFDAWTHRDADGIIAAFAEGGTYSDPTVGQGISREAAADYARGLWDVFPDLTFEIISNAEAGPGTVVAQWLMRGTNTGSLQGLPPTGRSVAVPGADFIQVEGDKILSVQGYFDSRAVPEQLGLQVVVQPNAIGPFVFGTGSLAQSGKMSNRERLVSLCSKAVPMKK